jgi:hypothetical protein
LGQQTHPPGNRPNQLITRRQIPLPQPIQVRVHPRGRQHRQASGWKKALVTATENLSFFVPNSPANHKPTPAESLFFIRFQKTPS